MRRRQNSTSQSSTSRRPGRVASAQSPTAPTPITRISEARTRIVTSKAVAVAVVVVLETGNINRAQVGATGTISRAEIGITRKVKEAWVGVTVVGSSIAGRAPVPVGPGSMTMTLQVVLMVTGVWVAQDRPEMISKSYAYKKCNMY